MEWADKSANLVRILDYKTGKPDDHLKAIESCDDLSSPGCEGYLRQLVAYKLLYEKDRNHSAGRTVSSASLVFIEPVSADSRRFGYKKGEYVTKDIRITDEMVINLENLIKDVWKNVKELRFEKMNKRDEKICRNCDFDQLCW